MKHSYINNLPIIIDDLNFTVLQYCDQHNISVPRFCYHEKLSIAGNCRMCLIELESSIKPIIACSTSFVPNARYNTLSQTVKKIRENVLELLLINHPLDCPICDQGGECDLQDQTMIFGSDKGRYKEIKRSVEDKEFGGFIKTIMTRCIHCTRCVRFFEEIAGEGTMGTFGRGRDTEIGTYANATFNSVLSGNVIDLCPVGALTSKPYAFTSRPWELESLESVDILDTLCSKIKIDYKGGKIMRILPNPNGVLNEGWITDFTRFSYDGYYNNRLGIPSLYDSEKDVYTSISWSNALEKVNYMFNKNIYNFLLELSIGNLSDLNTIFHLKKWINFCSEKVNIKSGLNNAISHFVKNFDAERDLSQSNSILLCLNPLPQSLPLLNSRIQKIKWNKGKSISVFYLGKNIRFSYDVQHLGLGLRSLFCLSAGKLKSSMKYPITDVIGYKGLPTISSDVYFKKSHSITNSLSDKALEWLHIKNSNDTAYSYDSDKLERISYTIQQDGFFNKPKQSVGFSIYQGTHMISGANRANLILPASGDFEESGYYLNIENNVVKSNKSSYSFAKSKSNLEIFQTLLSKIDTRRVEKFDFFDLFVHGEKVKNKQFLKYENMPKVVATETKGFVNKNSFATVPTQASIRNSVTINSHFMRNLKLKNVFIKRYSTISTLILHNNINSNIVAKSKLHAQTTKYTGSSTKKIIRKKSKSKIFSKNLSKFQINNLVSARKQILSAVLKGNNYGFLKNKKNQIDNFSNSDAKSFATRDYLFQIKNRLSKGRYYNIISRKNFRSIALVKY